MAGPELKLRDYFSKALQCQTAEEQAAYLETAIEDDEIAERMDAGRAALYKAGRSEEGPYQSPLEDGMQHFHEFLRRELDVPLQSTPGKAPPGSVR